MIEEQQAQDLWQQQQYQQQRRPQSRTRQQQQQQQQQQPNASPPLGGNDTMGDIQEHFSRIAACKSQCRSKEVKEAHYIVAGKKTFGAFMDKVKAKIQEFDK
jgi:hypothetical protein